MSKKSHTAAIVTLRNAADRIGRMIAQFRRIPVDEVCVVVCGSDDNTVMAARRHGARVVEAPASTTEGTAISLGVSGSPSADVFICTGGRFVYPAEWLIPYIDAVRNGADVVLNDVSSVSPQKTLAQLCSAFLNYACGADHAGCNSLAAYPFGMSRSAVAKIGPHRFKSLPAALMAAHLDGLRVASVGPTPTTITERFLGDPGEIAGVASPGERDAFREYMDALAELIDAAGPRGMFADGCRRRDLLVRG